MSYGSDTPGGSADFGGDSGTSGFGGSPDTGLPGNLTGYIGYLSQLDDMTSGNNENPNPLTAEQMTARAENNREKQRLLAKSRFGDDFYNWFKDQDNAYQDQGARKDFKIAQADYKFVVEEKQQVAADKAEDLKDQKYRAELAKARAGASGLRFGGTVDSYLSDLANARIDGMTEGFWGNY